jgi:2-dehydro-3-deoxy-D-arabinonate dehydratase
MKLCRFEDRSRRRGVALVLEDQSLLDLSTEAAALSDLLELDDLLEHLARWTRQNLPRHRMNDVRLLAPVDRQEVWAAGVTYLRSKKARMAESDFSAIAYDKVYEAPRPELFFKSLAEKVAGPDEDVGIRGDARWNVPEPELALLLNSRGRLAGFTIGNDMSSRDIEGENLLYLPQAKIYHRSCALGPFVTVGAAETQARAWTIQLAIERSGEPAFQGETSVGQIKRGFGELAEFLFRSQKFPYGAVLLTGTGIVPPDTFILRPGDTVRISISGIGCLTNTVTVV